LTRIEDAVRRILRVKLQTRLFKQPLTDPALTAKVGCAEHRQVARECVRQSLVLLKNGKQVLPLSRKLPHLHVVGNAAQDLGMQCGGWTISWQGRSGKVIEGGKTILEAVRQSLPGGRVTFAPDGSGAAGADAVLAVVGELPYAEMKGDRKDLGLPAADLAVLRKAQAAGVPVITVLLSGRPLILGPAWDASDALVAAWLPGTEGHGVADVLFGDYKPTGKLPHIWPRSMDQLPCHDGDVLPGGPQFPYGFGLTY
jgi:beta-glucosidase